MGLGLRLRLWLRLQLRLRLLIDLIERLLLGAGTEFKQKVESSGRRETDLGRAWGRLRV